VDLITAQHRGSFSPGTLHTSKPAALDTSET
jgi:hypothetical protein